MCEYGLCSRAAKARPIAQSSAKLLDWVPKAWEWVSHSMSKGHFITAAAPAGPGFRLDAPSVNMVISSESTESKIARQ